MPPEDFVVSLESNMKKNHTMLINIGLSAVLSVVITLLTSRIQLPMNTIGEIFIGTAGADYTIGFPAPIWIHTVPTGPIMEYQKLATISGWPLNFFFYFLMSFLIIHMSRKLLWKTMN